MHGTDRAIPEWDLAVKLTDPCDKDALHIAELRDQGKTLHLRHISLEFYEITDMPQFERDGIEFLTTIKTYPTLESITLHKLYFENKHSRILVVDEQVESKGSEQIISVIDDLISIVNATNANLGRTGNYE
ncbi:hypothetical protein E4T48_00820 [Aureobasidium sp. EXF-10727]|nr:hypothetical protein E4T48_00820 [Aureobasidium sp. EXF-10727]